MKAILTAAAVLAIYPLVAQVHNASRFSLTEADIASALALGQTGEPAPHLVPCLAAKPAKCAVAAVYTPFVRVALASRAARQKGRALGRDGVTPDLIEERFYAALRYDVPLDRAPFGDRVKYAPLRAVLLPTGLTPVGQELKKGVRPDWAEPSTARLDVFGGAPPFKDTALVVAFPLDNLQAGYEIAVYRSATIGRGGEVAQVTFGRLTNELIAGWR